MAAGLFPQVARERTTRNYFKKVATDMEKTEVLNSLPQYSLAIGLPVSLKTLIFCVGAGTVKSLPL